MQIGTWVQLDTNSIVLKLAKVVQLAAVCQCKLFDNRHENMARALALYSAVKVYLVQIMFAVELEQRKTWITHNALRMQACAAKQATEPI